MDKKLLLAAHDIIHVNLYATLATVTSDGSPWSTPVFICNDSCYTFYWASGIESQHSRNIANNGLVSMVIFDSQAAWGEGTGVYIEGAATVLTDSSAMDQVCKLRIEKSGNAMQSSADYSGSSPRRLYACRPKNIWINSEAVVNGIIVDNRTPIDLAQLVQP